MKVNENLTMAERMKAAIVAKIVRAGLVAERDASRIRLSDVPYFIDWATGFGGIWLVGETTAGEEFFYTPEQWNALDDATRGERLSRAVGMLFRAQRKEFVFALQDCPGTYAWCLTSEDGTTPQVEITPRGGSQGAVIDFNGQENTTALLSVASPAAKAAVDYKATGIHGAAAADWYLPAFGHWALIFAYRNKVNAALKTFFGTNNYIAQATYWSSTPSDSIRAWTLPNPGTASCITNPNNPLRTTSNKVRACSQYKCTKRYLIHGKY